MSNEDEMKALQKKRYTAKKEAEIASAEAETASAEAKLAVLKEKLRLFDLENVSTDTKENAPMSIEDQVKARKKERERRKIERKIKATKAKISALKKRIDDLNLKKAWNESIFTKADTIVVPCPSEYKELIDDLVDNGHLRFIAPMIFGKAPDGSMRSRILERGETSNCRGFVLEKETRHTRGGGSGKDAEPISYYYTTHTMWILNNKHIYISDAHELFKPNNLRKWFIDWIADGKPETTWERKSERKSERESESKREREEKEKIKKWKEQGLCTHCGGQRSFWSGRCKQCGRR